LAVAPSRSLSKTAAAPAVLRLGRTSESIIVAPR
jgi:hypothetical protein